VQMLAKCLDDTPDTLSVPSPSCKFNPLIANTDHVVKLSIDTINIADGFADISIFNPQEAVSAFQFSVSGLSVDSVRLLSVADSGIVILRYNSSGKIMASMLHNRIPKNTQPEVFLRIYFDSTTANQVCISEISAILNPEMQLLGKSAGPCKNTGTITYIGQKYGKTGLRLVPNPFSTQSHLYFSNPSNQIHTLFLFDSYGKLVRTQGEIQGSDCLISGDGLLPGVYFFQLFGKESRSGKLWIEK